MRRYYTVLYLQYSKMNVILKKQRDSFKTLVFRKGMKFCDIKTYKIKFKSLLFGYVLSNVKAA